MAQHSAIECDHPRAIIAPRGRLTPDFLSAIQQADIPQTKLAVQVGIDRTPLGRLLSPGSDVILTPLTIRRLQAIAQVIGYTGPTFTPHPARHDA